MIGQVSQLNLSLARKDKELGQLENDLAASNEGKQTVAKTNQELVRTKQELQERLRHSESVIHVKDAEGVSPFCTSDL